MGYCSERAKIKMGITTLNFFIFLIISVFIYYIFPKKYRWIILLVTSILFYIFSGAYTLLLYVLLGIVTTYIGTRFIEEKASTETLRKTALFITLTIIVTELFILKYINIIPVTINGILGLFNINIGIQKVNIIAPLGISYYTLTLIGYTIDVYRGTSKPQKNIFKHALFTCYYPNLISGPIVRYEHMKKELFEPKEYCFRNIISGAVRIIFGLLKKMVIADQIAVVVTEIFMNYQLYTGLYIIIGVLLYAIQIYADFSGCIDIVLGVSKMYGVTVPENFESPFFSRNLSEFWRRWHISLGLWGKDYIMYPLLKSNKFQTLANKCKEKFGKKIGKKIPTILAIFILWILIGFWHGASYQYIFAAGILPWLYLVASEFLEPVFKAIKDKLKINTTNFSYRLFESLRTISLMCFIWLFTLIPSLEHSLDIIMCILKPTNFDYRIDLPQLKYSIILFSCLIVLIVDYLKYKNIDVLKLFHEQNIVFKYIVVFGILYIILIYGAYGPGYNAVDFIYGGF